MSVRQLNADQVAMARGFIGSATAKNAMLFALLEQFETSGVFGVSATPDAFSTSSTFSTFSTSSTFGASGASCATDADHISVWGDFDARGRLKALAANEHNRWMLWHHEDDRANVDWRGIAEVITATGQPFYYKGPFNQWQPLHRIIGAERTYARTSFVLSRLIETKAIEEAIERGAVSAAAATRVRQCTHEHLPELAIFYEQAGSMRRSLEELEKLMDRQQRFYAIWDEERIVSAAFTEFEGADFASIICVFTDPSKRRLGYSASCVCELTHALLSDGKIAWLYWNNPAAGRLYYRLGYRPESLWIRCNYDAAF